MPIECSLDPRALQAERQRQVQAALCEDIGSGDITGQLVAAETRAEARVVCREAAVLCGRDWFDAVFAAVDPQIEIQWQAEDGDRLTPNQTLVTLTGAARGLLTGERCGLNFLQTLSATATRAARYAELVADTPVKLLDTRKTLPGLRLAQKYAVACGGCHNHRIGLFDAFLIKENHIAACGGIANAIARAQQVAPGKPVEVEVETLDELRQALAAGAERIMLDNFELADIQRAVAETAGRAELEVSGNITRDTLLPLAHSGVDFLSIGDLTKSVQAIDLSMRLQML